MGKMYKTKSLAHGLHRLLTVILGLDFMNSSMEDHGLFVFHVFDDRGTLSQTIVVRLTNI